MDNVNQRSNWMYYASHMRYKWQLFVFHLGHHAWLSLIITDETQVCIDFYNLAAVDRASLIALRTLFAMHLHTKELTKQQETVLHHSAEIVIQTLCFKFSWHWH